MPSLFDYLGMELKGEVGARHTDLGMSNLYMERTNVGMEEIVWGK